MASQKQPMSVPSWYRRPCYRSTLRPFTAHDGFIPSNQIYVLDDEHKIIPSSIFEQLWKKMEDGIRIHLGWEERYRYKIPVHHIKLFWAGAEPGTSATGDTLDLKDLREEYENWVLEATDLDSCEGRIFMPFLEYEEMEGTRSRKLPVLAIIHFDTTRKGKRKVPVFMHGKEA